MTDLDVTGQRANSPGLTPAAERAAKKAQNKAKNDAFWAAAGRGALWCLSKVPVVLVVAVVLSILISATIFDWYMSSRGWLDILPGISVFAWFGAAAAVGFWYIGAFMFGEQIDQQMRRPKDSKDSKDPKTKRDWTLASVWGVVAVVSYLVCVGGVVVATITNTAEAKFAAETSRKEYAGLVARRDELAENLEINNVDYWEARLDADKRTARGRLNIAKATLGMADLDVDGGCAQKLNFNQQRACAYWNGGTDPHTGSDVVGILTELQQDEAGLERARTDTDDLNDVRERVRTFTVKTGDETARALGDYLASETAGNQALMAIITFFSAGFLLCGGLFGYGAWRLLVRKAV